MSDRYIVRIAPSFFEDLDRQLPVERGPHGEPSSVDFRSIEIVEIIDRFASGFDQLGQPIPGRPDYRILLKGGLLVRGIQVVGQLMPDGAIELLTLDLDLSMDWD